MNTDKTYMFEYPTTRILYLIGADEVTFGAAYRYMFWAVNIGVVPAIMNVVMSYMVKSVRSLLVRSLFRS